MTKFQNVIDSYSSKQNNRSDKYRILLEHYLTSTESRFYKALELKLANDLSQWDICFLLGVHQSRFSLVIKQSSSRLGSIDAILRHPKLQREVNKLKASLDPKWELPYADLLLSGAFLRDCGFSIAEYKHITERTEKLKLPLLLNLFRHVKKARFT